MENYNEFDDKDLLELLDMGVKMAVKDLKGAVIRPKGSRFMIAGFETSLLGIIFLVPVAIISYLLGVFHLTLIDWIAKVIMYPVLAIIGIGVFSILLGIIMSGIEWMNEIISRDDL